MKTAIIDEIEQLLWRKPKISLFSRRAAQNKKSIHLPARRETQKLSEEWRKMKKKTDFKIK